MRLARLGRIMTLTIIMIFSCLSFSYSTTEAVTRSKTNSYGLQNPYDDKDSEYQYPKIWDTVWFGTYVQDDITGIQKNSIRWRVLQVEGNSALLISDEVLDAKPFHTNASVDAGSIQ